MAAKSVLEIVINGTDNFTKNFAKSLDKVGDKMQKLGGIMTASVTLPIVAMGVKAVSAASDLTESMNAVNVVFGDSADIIADFSKQSATAVGMSASEFAQAAAVMGAFLQNVGFDAAGAAEETVTLGQRAADMASIFNTDVGTALAAIQSGLKGEFNPLEQFGVKMNAAAIEAKALSMGLVGTTKDLTAITAANIKVAKSQEALREAVAKYGEGSLEAMEKQVAYDKALGGLTESLVGVRDEITDTAKAQAALALIYEQTNKLSGDFQNTSDGLANSQKILKAQFEDVSASIGTILIPVALQLVGVLTSVLTWVSKLTPEQQKLAVVIAAVAAAIGPLLVVLGTLLKAFSTIAMFISGPTMAALGSLLLPIAAIVAAIVLLALAWKNNWGDIQGKTQVAVDWIKGVVDKFLAALKAFWEEHKEQIMGLVNAMWTFLKTLFDTASKIITQVVGAALVAIQAFWDEHGAAIMEIVSALWEWVEGAFETAVAAVTLIFQALTAALKGDWEGFGTYLRQAAIKVFDFLIDAADAVWEAIKSIDWLALGTAIVQGIANGIKAGAKWIVDAAKAAAAAALAAAKALLGIKSPSSVFAEVGKNMMLGMAGGITNNAFVPAMAGSRAAAAVTAQTTNNFSINMTGTGSAGADVLSSVRLLELLYG